jgi:gliding-associated putative ABC transporter substrate-binding component GldG
LLSNIKKINPNKVTVSVEVPNELFKDTALYKFYDSLVKLGLPIERVQNENGKEDKRVDQLVVPGALVEVAGKAPYTIDLRSSKKYFKPYNIVKDIPEEDPIANENAAEALLEYKFTQALYLLHRKDIPTIAYLIGNGEPVDLTVNDLGALIKDQYQLKVFDLKKGFPDASKIKTLLIVKPSQTFSTLDKLKIDQYLMHGGNIIWAIDKLNAEYDSLRNTDGSYIAMDRGLALDDLFFKYGLRINSNLIQDLNCAKIAMVTGKKPDGSPMMNRVPWPYYPFVTGNDNASLSQNMDRVLTAFPSSIDTINTAGIHKTILLSTDTSSRILTSPNLVSLQSVKGEADMAQFTQHHLAVAVLLEGKFSSLYDHRISNAEKDSIQLATGKPFMARATQSAKQIVLSDANIITNQVKPEEQGNYIPLPMGMMPIEEYQFGNRDFYMNSVSFLNEPQTLLENRHKTIVLRVLDRQKLEANRLFWQLILVLGPLLLLWLGGWFWMQNRKRSFATLG